MSCLCKSLQINKPHLAYAVIGGFTTVFSLFSLFVKEKLYIGEATIAGIFGIIVGPHCLNWFAPTTWGNTDNITLELSRIVLVVQIFAVAVELPKKYMLRHWFSVTLLLLPVMTFGWLLTSVFIWKLVPTLRWIEALVISACVTATDPVLASAVVGKGKFAQRVPGHLRNILSAESACNDGMAFPFAYLALLCILHEGHPRDIAFHWIVIAVIYECIFGCVLGAIIGYLGRHLIKFAEQKKLIDRESFLVFYFVLALFCTGVGSIVGVDDLLVAFSAGAAFSWDGWFSKKTEESHVSDVIDLLLNMAFFVYFGAIVPWDQFNNLDIGISVWKLVIIAILVILFRRIPIMLALKPIIPDIKTWREALFCGHFGPIGVGGIFMAILSRAELEHEEPTPLAELPGKEHPHYYAVATIWPVVTFLIISSIIVHGSSIAVFTLGKRLNNLSITLTATTKGSTSQGWLSRIGTESRTFSLHRVDTYNPDLPPIAPSSNPEKPGLGRRKRHRKAHKRRRNGEEPTPPAAIALDLGGHGRTTIINQTDADNTSSSFTKNNSQEPSLDEEENHIAIVATGEDGEESEVKLKPSELTPQLREKLGVSESGEPSHPSSKSNSDINAYKVGDDIVLEDHHGEVLQTINSNTSRHDKPPSSPKFTSPVFAPLNKISPSAGSPPPRRRRNSLIPRRGSDANAAQVPASRSSGPRKIMAYQLDDDIVVENEEGEIIKRYHINYKDPNNEGAPQNTQSSGTSNILSSGLNSTLSHLGLRRRNTVSAYDLEKQSHANQGAESSGAPHTRLPLNDEQMRKHLKHLLTHDNELGHVNEETDDGTDSSDEYTSDDEDEGPKSFNNPEKPMGSSGLNAMGRRVQPQKAPPHLDEDEEETEVERQRRLAALGIINDDEDEDEDHRNANKVQPKH